ncbi:MAG: hypothetical protein SP1CHLAM54_05520 [Chlamydiia bacterium]|nr:hypothetical protein [Chlamydiia bacterium]MCH9615462.1 hypothetical protein [Chlamydiia bacterium]MCH9629117.1 hypothetical protein [Chlamydiia bacterium]
MKKYLPILLTFLLVACSSSLPRVKGPISLYYQEASDSTLVLRDGEYLLHLLGTSENILAFSGDPIERSGDRTFEAFKKDFTYKNFNAALIVNHEATMLRLAMPTYNEAKKVMTYVVKPIGELNTELIGKHLGKATLIIEPERTEQVKKLK